MTEDTVTYFTFMEEGQVVPDTVHEALEVLGRTNFIEDSIDAVFFAHNQGNKEFGYSIFRIALFENETFLHAFDYAVFVFPNPLNAFDTHVVTAVLDGDTIKQYKIHTVLHRETNLEGRLWEEDFHFTFHDTLATSKLIINPDGSVLGKNLVHWW